MNFGHHLLLNASMMEKTCKVRRVMHRPRPYARNPLILGTEFCDREKLIELEKGKAHLAGQKESPDMDQHKLAPTRLEKGFDPWFVPSQFGARVVYPASVVHSPLTGRLQMYYWVNGGLDFAESGWTGGSSVTCYAESDDGINWELPLLKRVKVFGSDENNVLFGPGGYPYVVVDPHAKDPQKRYQAFIHPGPRIAFSPDGLHWSAPQDAFLETKIGRSDGDTFFGWDENHQKYVTYFRPWKEYPDDRPDKHFRRRIGRAVSDDLLHWSDHHCVLSADEKDPEAAELERMLVFRYADVYLGLIVVFLTTVEQRHAISHMIGYVYLELAYSNDGIQWHRFEERDPFISYLPGVKDYGLALAAQGCVEVDDQLHFYYEATHLLHGQLPCSARCHLARLPRDRFVGYRADESEGYVQTKFFECPGGKLRVNADVTQGELRVGVIQADGFHSVEHAEYRCNSIQGDHPEHTVGWFKTDNLDALKGQKIALKFYLRNAEAFSYWFD